MSKLKLTFACWDYDRTRALVDGTIEPEGIKLNCLRLAPNETFFRMFRHQDFDVSELSLSSYSTFTARGNCPFVAIPVFPSRSFRHSSIYVNTAAGIEQPGDLKGKRIGVPEYQVTAAVFARGMLHHDYGVAPQDVDWYWGGLEHPGRVSLVNYQLPEWIHLTKIPDDKTLSAMLEAGEIDALIAPNTPSPFARNSPKVKRLFPNSKQLEMDYYRRTRIFPIMHIVVLRRDIYEHHPWAAQSLLKAFVHAKKMAEEGIYVTEAMKVMLPWLIDHIDETRAAMGEDYWPYGIERNHSTLDAFTTYLVEQGLTERKLTPGELFTPNTLEEFRI